VRPHPQPFPLPFCDKIVFIAATAAGLGDMKLVPLFGYISGVKIHTNLFLNMLYGNFISEISKTAYYILLFLTSLSYTFLFYTRSELSPIKKYMVISQRILNCQ
jgi:CHASE2 domain-containing sensor protein